MAARTWTAMAPETCARAWQRVRARAVARAVARVLGRLLGRLPNVAGVAFNDLNPGHVPAF